MSEIKLIGVDLDGTVLDSNKLISDENIGVFKMCREKGIYVVPVTGRPFSGLYKEYINDIGCEYSIHTNGAVVMDLKTNKQIISHNIRIDKAKEIVKVLQNFSCYYVIFYKGFGYLNEERYGHELEKYQNTPLHRYILTSRKAVKSQSEFLNSINFCDNLYVIAENTQTRDEICKEIKNYRDIFFTCSDVNDIEIGGNCSKGRTLLELGTYLGIDKDEIMAIGDSGNDLDMLKMAGISVAMGNASEEIKSAADFVTKSCQDNGVAFAVKKYINI